jgi:glutathione S-transferase
MKVPAIAYGGPQVSPDDPSDESEKIAESLVILEFVADLYPNSPLLPKDPVLRARVRFFIDAVSTKFVPAFYGTIVHAESSDGFFKAVKAIQDLLPAEGKGEYAIGDEFTLADAAIAPFIGRVDLTLKNDLGAYQEGEGTKIYETLQSNTKFSRFGRYAQHLKDRASFKGTFDEVSPEARHVLFDENLMSTSSDT